MISVEGNEVSIQSGDGSVFVVIVDESTRIKLEEDSHGSLTGIPIGADIEAKFDPETRVAFKLDLEQEEAEVEGWVENIDGDQITIRTKNGRLLTVTVGENVRIKLADDFPGTVADIVAGLKIEVDFDPSSLAAYKIELEQDEAEIEGWVVKIEGDQVTIRTENGYEMTVTIGEDTQIELDDDWAGAVTDIMVGLKIELDFDPSSLAAYKIEIEQEKDEVEGWVENIEGDQVTIRGENGSMLTVTVGENTRIEMADDFPGTLADITVGLKIELDFDPSSLAAYKIEIEQEKDEVEGWVENIEGDQVTIRGENGSMLTVTVGENTRIELDDDLPGTLTDIVGGLKIEVDFDPSSLAAYKIEIDH